jgi:hypothetical protein
MGSGFLAAIADSVKLILGYNRQIELVKKLIFALFFMDFTLPF